MKKNLFLRFVMVVFVVLFLAGCMEADSGPVAPIGPKILSGDISISPSSGVTVGNQLAAEYSGTETVTYQWNLDGTDVPDATGRTYSPPTAGNYTVTVSAAGYESKTSPAVTVTDRATENPTVINIAAIAGITIPATGGIPVTAITENVQYSGTVTWNGNPSVFAASTVYTATISLTAKDGYTLQGVEANFFTVEGATSVSNSANSSVITAVFPSTAGNMTAPTYGISLSTIGTHTFPPDEVGYSAQTPLTVTVSNTGNQATGNLTASLSGTDSGSFTLSITSISDIAAGGSNTFAVVPNTGLAIGTYTATVTLSGNNSITASFLVSFTVIDVSSPYIITGSGTAFTATRSGITIGTADQPIQDVINSIRTNATGRDRTIQFGDGITALNTGTAPASFNNDGGTWGLVTLSGKINSGVSNDSSGTIYVADSVSVTSSADIANTAGNSIGNSIYNTGSLTISGGMVSATTGTAVINASLRNASPGSLTISGGTVSATTGTAVENASRGGVTISGGTVSATTGVAVVNYTGKITVSGTALVTSMNSSQFSGGGGTIVINGSSLEIIGGTVQAKGCAVRNNSSGAVNISGGVVSSEGYYAVLNISTGTVNISGGAVSSKSETVCNTSSGAVNISGGTVSTTIGQAVRNESTGVVSISGGTVSATAGTAVLTAGKTIVSGTALVTSAGLRTIDLHTGIAYGQAPLEIIGGTVENTADNGKAINNYEFLDNVPSESITYGGAIIISGGTVQATGNNSYAVYNNTLPWVVTITSPPAVIVGDMYGVTP
jgi:hypothetical protein